MVQPAAVSGLVVEGVVPVCLVEQTGVRTASFIYDEKLNISSEQFSPARVVV